MAAHGNSEEWHESQSQRSHVRRDQSDQMNDIRGGNSFHSSYTPYYPDPRVGFGSLPSLTPEYRPARPPFATQPRRRAAPSTPLNLTPRRRADTLVLREIYCALSIWDGQDVHVDGQTIFMRKIMKLRPPIAIQLPGSMKWGGSYDGGAFRPGTAQLGIAQQVAAQEWCESNCATIAGCFLTVARACQHKPGNKTLGCGSIEPFYLDKDTEWRNFPRGKKVLYVPNPMTSMTAPQINFYRVSASRLNGPTMIVPTQPDPGNTSTRKWNRSGGSNAGVNEEPLDWEVDTLPSSPDSWMNSAEMVSTLNTAAEETRVNTVLLKEPILLEDSDSRTTELISNSEIGSPVEDNGQTGTSCHNPIRLDIGNESTRRQSPADGQMDHTGYARQYDDAFLDDTDERIVKTDRLTEDYCAAKQKLKNLEAGVHSTTVNADLPENRFWEIFEAILQEERDRNSGRASSDLELLKTRRDLKFGLKKRMLENIVTPMLAELPSFGPFSKFDFEQAFQKAAIPSWEMWETVGDINPTLNPEYVAESFTTSLQLLRDSSRTFSPPTITEQDLATLREDYIGWREKQVINSRLDVDDEYMEAKKECQRTKRMLAVHQISDCGLYYFRRVSQREKYITIHFCDGGELDEIRKTCQGITRRSAVFPDFRAQLTYTTPDGKETIDEHETIDAGGVTGRFLTRAWQSLFEGRAEFHAVFVEGQVGLHHLNTRKYLSDIVKKDIEVVGQLMFLIILKKQLVNRPMTMATIAHAMGICPSREEIRTQVLHGRKPSIYLEDFAGFRPPLNSLMQRLIAGRKEGCPNELENMEIIAPEYSLRLGSVNTNAALSEEEFLTSMKLLYADIVYETLFLDCAEVGGYLRNGFKSLITSTKFSRAATDCERKLVLNSAFNNVSVKAMSAFFTAELGITSREFLSRVRYSFDMPAEVRDMFIEAVGKFTPVETYRLHKYITDEKYVGGSLIRVAYFPLRSATSLPMASTCLKQLELPSYTDVEMMRAKLTLATFSTSYGKA